MRNLYVSEVQAFILAVTAIVGIVLITLVGRPIPDILNNVALSAVVFFFGHANGTKVQRDIDKRTSEELRNG